VRLGVLPISVFKEENGLRHALFVALLFTSSSNNFVAAFSFSSAERLPFTSQECIPHAKTRIWVLVARSFCAFLCVSKANSPRIPPPSPPQYGPHPHETGNDRQRSDYVAAPLSLNGLASRVR
jgi:hypothetical protein